MSAEQAYAQINRLIDQQAFTRAADDIFLASSFLFLSLIVLIWFTKRPASRRSRRRGRRRTLINFRQIG
jgi:DHA2 family multidrug resistance protein